MDTITKFLRRRDMSQKQFAELVGVSQPTVWAWIHGRSTPGPKQIARIADVIGCRPVKLLNDAFKARAA